MTTASSSARGGTSDDGLLTQILCVLPYVVFWKDRASVYLGCSDSFAALAGLRDPAAVVGLTDFDMPWSREESEGYRADDRQVMDSGKPKLHIIETLRTPTGEQMWLDTSKVPLLDSAGRVIGVVGIFVDITERKRTEQDLQRTRQHLEDAIEAIDAGLVMYDAAERLVFCNEKYRRIYPEVADSIVPGSRYRDLLSRYAAHGERVLPPGTDPEQWVVERLAHHRRCERRWEQVLRDRVIQVSDSRTRDGGIVSLRTDITAAKRHEQELHDAREAAIAASAAKTSFLANMSHEIRTPMTAILGFAEVLQNSSPRADQQEPLRTIQRNGEHLLRLINDILDLSKIEAGKFELERERIDLGELVDEVLSLMVVRADSKSLHLRAEFSDLTPRHVQCDATRLRQILVNLVGNALKFTEQGGVTLRISADRRQGDRGLVRIAVEDTGIGIREGQLERVFGAFEQGDVSTTRAHGGTGLGLAISRRLARLLGGDIEATSTLGEGSCFTVQLPVGCDTEWIEPAAIKARRPVPATPAASVSRPLPLRGTAILLAEDGRDNQLLISHFLRTAGATITLAKDGEEAVRRVEEARGRGARFDVIFMDMQMPTLDGYSATQVLRAAGVDMPIVALTAHAMSGDRERCLTAGCDDYLHKPAKQAELVAMAEKWSRADRVDQPQ